MKTAVMSLNNAFPALELKNLTQGEAGIRWNQINWKKVELTVRRIQNSIANCNKYGNFRKMRKLQRILWNSWSNKVLGIRKVTQDNKGKKTAGIDGMKNLTQKQRVSLIKNCSIYGKWQKVKQVEIPKKNGKMRTLGIPTMKDRARQLILKAGLEPAYEAMAEESSYGFRPGRQTKDAIEKIFAATCKRKKWVIEGDLKGFFDNIKPEAIIKNSVIGDNVKLQQSLKNLIESGAINVKGVEVETDRGTPQGGVISPLLANIAFMGLETFIKEWAWENRKKLGIKGRRDNGISLAVYADDFVVTTKEKWIAESLKESIKKWCFDKMGVELSEEKTKITSTTEGFDFLGYNIRHYIVNEKLKLLIKPSKDSIKRVKDKIRTLCKEGKSLNQDVLIAKLNSVIRGWGLYYRNVVSKDVFSSIDYYVYKCVIRWAIKRHANKGRKWVAKRYFKKIGNRNWVFQDTKTLIRMSDISIKRHIMIKGSHHIYDGDAEYWNKRALNALEQSFMGRTSGIKTKLLKKQGGQCEICKLNFRVGDIMELDHIVPKTLGGKDIISNYQLIHGHCHDTKTSQDGSLQRKGKTLKKY
jgi:RNA-directed DNA polymerase